MTSHDIDSRFAGSAGRSNLDTTTQKKISLVANLYLPLIAICLDNLGKVCERINNHIGLSFRIKWFALGMQ